MVLRRGALATAVVAALGALAWPCAARAEPYLGAGLGATWLDRSPPVRAESLELGARTVGKGALATRGGLVMFGGYVDGGLTIADRLVIPIFGVGLQAAVGSYDEVLTSRDGSLATLRPWSAYSADIFLPGFGVRAKLRRWMLAAVLRTGVSILFEGGSIVDGGGAKPFQGDAASFLLAGQLEACRRLDPEQRVCLEIAPRLFEFGWMNGATVGLRYEIGR